MCLLGHPPVLRQIINALKRQNAVAIDLFLRRPDIPARQIIILTPRKTDFNNRNLSDLLPKIKNIPLNLNRPGLLRDLHPVKHKISTRHLGPKSKQTIKPARPRKRLRHSAMQHQKEKKANNKNPGRRPKAEDLALLNLLVSIKPA